MVQGIKWGGSGIERVLFDFIRSRIPKGATVIELGAGYVSTIALSLIYNLYSVEHKEQFINKVENVRYIHAPETNGWYDIRVLTAQLPPVDEQSMVLIDGLNRTEILKYLHIFNRNALFIVHDTYRIEEQRLALDLATMLSRQVDFYTTGDYWASI